MTMTGLRKKVSVDYAGKTTYFGTICADIADSVSLLNSPRKLEQESETWTERSRVKRVREMTNKRRFPKKEIFMLSQTDAHLARVYPLCHCHFLLTTQDSNVLVNLVIRLLP